MSTCVPAAGVLVFKLLALLWACAVCGGTVHCVSLRYNSIGDKGCTALAQALDQVSSLKTLKCVVQWRCRVLC
jgi:hypothetical protein